MFLAFRCTEKCEMNNAGSIGVEFNNFFHYLYFVFFTDKKKTKKKKQDLRISEIRDNL